MRRQGEERFRGHRGKEPPGQSPLDEEHLSFERKHGGLALKSELIAKSCLSLLCSLCVYVPLVS